MLTAAATASAAATAAAAASGTAAAAASGTAAASRPRQVTRETPSTGTCRVRTCACTTNRRRGASRTIALPGTPRVGRPGAALPAQKEAAGARAGCLALAKLRSRQTSQLPNAWHPFHRVTKHGVLTGPRCSCDAGTPGRHRRPRRPRRPGLKVCRERDRGRACNCVRDRDSGRGSGRDSMITPGCS